MPTAYNYPVKRNCSHEHVDSMRAHGKLLAMLQLCHV